MTPHAPRAPGPSWPHKLLALARNAVPVVGVLALGWSPAQYVLLFLADACLRPGALGAAKLLSDFGGIAASAEAGFAERLDGVVTIIAAGLFLAGVLFAAFGVPVFALVLTSDGWAAELRSESFRLGAAAVLALAAAQSVGDARWLARDRGNEAAMQRRVTSAMALLTATYFCAFVATLFGGAGLRVLAVLLALLVTYTDWHPHWGERVFRVRTPPSAPPPPPTATQGPRPRKQRKR